MIRSRFLPVASIVFLLLLPGFPVGAAMSNQTVTFHSEEFGLSLKYPASWTTLPATEGVPLLIQSPDGKSAISVGAAFTQEHVDLGVVTAQVVQAQNAGMKVLKTKSSKIRGMPAKEFFTTQVSGGETLKGKQIWIANGQALYILAYASPPGTYTKALRVFDSFARSLMVEKGKNIDIHAGK